MTRRRSTPSRAIEIILSLAVVAGIYLFLTNGGPSWAGDLLGPLLAAP